MVCALCTLDLRDISVPSLFPNVPDAVVSKWLAARKKRESHDMLLAFEAVFVRGSSTGRPIVPRSEYEKPGGGLQQRWVTNKLLDHASDRHWVASEEAHLVEGER